MLLTRTCFCLVALLAVPTGCGTVMTHVHPADRERAFANGVYRGVRYDSDNLIGFREEAGSVNPILFLCIAGALVVDLPLCLVADTFMLPMDAFTRANEKPPP